MLNQIDWIHPKINSVKGLALTIAAIPVAMLCMVLAPYFLLQNQKSLEQALTEKAQSVANQLAYIGEYSLVSGDLDSINNVISQILNKQQELCDIKLIDQRNNLILQQTTQCVQDKNTFVINKPIYLSSPDIGTLDIDDKIHITSRETQAQPSPQNQQAGSVEIVISRHLLQQQQKQMLLNGILLICVALCLSLIVGYLLSRRITRPLLYISNAVKNITEKKYIYVKTESMGGEISELASNLNAMTKNLEQSKKSINKYIQKLKIAQKEAEEARYAAETANNSKSEFIALISHEIRTPLNVSMSLLQILEDTQLNDVQKRYVRNALRSSEHLLKLIDDLLDFSKLSFDKVSLEKQPCDIGELVQNIIDNTKPAAREKDLELNYHHLGELDIQKYLMIVDPTRLQQILYNLIQNAIKFTNQGKVTLNVKCKKIDDAKASIIFEVQDTGIGIADDQLELMFDAFERGEPNLTNRTYEGYGLGLNIVQQLITLMDGKLEVQSTLGVGSTFQCHLMIDYIKKANSFTSSKITTEELKGSNILLIEDNAQNQETFLLLFGQLEITIDTAKNGYEALQMHLEQYDVIFMDIHMPGMDGFELAKKIRQHENDNRSTIQQRIPIIAITADVQNSTKEKCFASGIDDFLAKPIRKFELYRITESWLKTKRQIWSIIDKIQQN